MKKLTQFLLITAGFAFSGAAIAETITPTTNPDPTPCDNTAPDATCWTAAGTPSQPSLEDLLNLIYGMGNYTLSEWDTLYKQEVGGAETGTFAGSYETTFQNTPTDPSGATITYSGGSSITCPYCFLWVKDGNQEPDLYVFDISWWDGQSTLSLEGFWPNQGAISNIGIIGKESMQVPEPGTLGLLGIGLLGLGVARRRRTAA